MPETISLPERLDGTAAQALSEQVLALRGQPIEVHVDKVEFIGALGFQVLVAAHRQWLSEELAFTIVGDSNSITDGCRLLGIPHEAIGLTPTTEAVQ